MTITHDTLLLDQSAWDLVLDANGDIALASAPYAIAQDVATAVRTWLGECYYDTTKGVNYANILGKFPSAQYLKSQIETAALSVADVAESQVVFISLKNRQLTGQIQVIDTDGKTSGVTF